MNLLKKFFRAQPVRAAWRTGLQAFIALFGIALLSFMQQVVTWSSDQSQVFPAVDPLIKALIAASIAAVVAIVTGIWNAIENKAGGALPGAPRGGEITPKP